MRTDALSCQVPARRRALFGNPDWNGLDFLEVLPGQQMLCVHFFGQVPPDVTVANIRIEGGRRIRGIRAVAIEIDRAHDPELDDCLRITLDKVGDFSTYRLCLVEDTADASREVCQPLHGIDRRFACLDFTFKVDCPSDLDCKPPSDCPPVAVPPPEINYLAKDYATFRQLILDRLALIAPDWKERHIPDLGITLVELLAYAGDHLSYYQDAVATEAYLDTARQRISLRRHARLVDYRMHEGNNARAWIAIETRTDLAIPANNVYFITGFTDIPSSSGRVVRHSDLDLVPRVLYEVFEPVAAHTPVELRLFGAHSRIRFYTWGDHECCLAKGATRATLLDEAPDGPSPDGPYGGDTPPDDLPNQYRGAAVKTAEAPSEDDRRILHLQPGDVIVFEEVLGPGTGNPADADPTHRHAVRLTRVTPNLDPLLGNRLVVDIEWGPEDALPFSLCLSTRLPAPDCRRIEDVSVARGNVVLVDHGRTESEPLGPVTATDRMVECRCEGSVIDRTSVPDRFNPALSDVPLTFAEPLVRLAPATRVVMQDPRLAMPHIVLTEYRVHDDTAATGPEWHTARDLLASSGEDRLFVAEIDDDGRALLRFGDGEAGRQPEGGTRFSARYRVGNGPAGNVGRETINYLVVREGTISADAILPTNPMAAQGGTAAESAAEVKLIAPETFRSRLERAITADDYAVIASRNSQVQRAAAELRWTGSWYEARVAIDPLNVTRPERAWLDEVAGYLHRYRRMGHDVAVVPARYVPLDAAIEVCVRPHVDRGHARAELLDVFSNRVRRTGALGVFHPNALSFGDGVYLSRLIAAAAAVDGVVSVKVTRLQRLGGPASDALDTGVLPLGPLEVALLDNDADFPENGRLELLVGGGR